MGYRERFDYERMAEEAARERDILQELLQRRRACPPREHDQELLWRRENSILYTMYLEQRCSARELELRARTRKEAVPRAR